MNRVQAGLLVLLVLVAAAPVAVATTGVGTIGTGATGASEPATATVEADLVEFRITVRENASARWTFTYTRILENDTERERFEAFAEEFTTNETDAYAQFRTQARGLAANGRNATGREMRAENFSRSAGLGGDCVTAQDCGSIRMSFTWTAFAAPDGDRLIVGDVFGSGLYLSAKQQLVFEAGPELAFASAMPDMYTPSAGTLADSGSITYAGEQTFSDSRPRIVLAPDQATGASGTATDDATTSPTDSTQQPGGGSGDGSDDDSRDDESPGDDSENGPPMALVGGLFVLLVGGTAAFVWWRGEGLAILPFDGPGDDGGAAAERAEGTTNEPAVPQEELLTDEDRVLKLLEENGGRMKQVDIVEETGWSKSKVSMLLSDMDEDDQISKLRVGRENIISLAGHEPEAAGSPHEEN